MRLPSRLKKQQKQPGKELLLLYPDIFKQSGNHQTKLFKHFSSYFIDLHLQTYYLCNNPITTANMSTDEMKLQIFRQIDSLEGTKLRELYGVVQNYLNSGINTEEWIDVDKEQQASILAAITEVNSGKVTPHHEVMARLRSKYGKPENN